MTQPPDHWEPVSSSDPGRQPPADDRFPPPYGSPPPGSTAGGAPPQYAYPQYGPQWGPAAGSSGTDDTVWAMMAYLGALAVGFIAPLVVYLVKKNESPLARFHGAQSLNYQITVFAEMMISALVAAALAIPLKQPGFLLLALPVWLFHLVAQWVFLILGAVKAGKGQSYRFPAFTCWRMIR